MISQQSQILKKQKDSKKSQCAMRPLFLVSALLIIHQINTFPKIKMISAMTTATPLGTTNYNAPDEHQLDSGWTLDTRQQQQQQPPILEERNNREHAEAEINEKRAFVMELLRMLYEQYGGREHANNKRQQTDDILEERRSHLPGQLSTGPRMMHQLLEAIGSDGDMRRLIDWIRNSFTPSAIPEVTTQFVVSKLGAVNCPALLQPDREDTLIPRFLLFNEHFVDVPFELSINPNVNECITNGKFDPRRKTIVLVHGYLTGYTLVDGITNIKNRILDLNRAINEKAIHTFKHDSTAHLLNGSSFVYTEDLNGKIRQQMYNVILVDWFNGANPTPRANYIRSAVNAQVVGRLIARFLSALIVQCGTPANNIQIIAHSLGECLACKITRLSCSNDDNNDSSLKINTSLATITQ